MSPDDDEYIGYVLSDVARLIRTVFDRRVRDIGLTRAQWLVLTRLYRRPGASQTELADMLEVDRASAGRMIDRMQKNGWVERRADNGDRRINRLYLTVDARRAHKDMWAIAEATVDDAWSGEVPFTVVYGADGKKRATLKGPLSLDALKRSAGI